MSGLLTSYDRRGDDVAGTQTIRIVLNAERGALYEGLARNLERHVPNSEVVLCEDMANLSAPDPLVRLLLVHIPAADVSSKLIYWQGIFPNAAVALLASGVGEEEAWRQLTESSLVQGYVPLDLKLPVWLAAVSLVLSGGQFYPVVRPRLNEVQHNSIAGPSLRASSNEMSSIISLDADIGPAELAGLTTREREILSLVAQGLQNKLIADRMQLSEHTVKVHVHNLMNKLHVTNRTQAAAAFHGKSSGHAAPERLGR